MQALLLVDAGELTVSDGKAIPGTLRWVGKVNGPNR
jgi:hypothetical protein